MEFYVFNKNEVGAKAYWWYSMGLHFIWSLEFS